MMAKGTMIYIRVQQGVLEDLFKAGVSRDLLQNKSALPLICEKLIEWAAAYAAHGPEAEALLEQREYAQTYQNTRRSKIIGKTGDLNRVLTDAEQRRKDIEEKLKQFAKENKNEPIESESNT